MSHQVVTPPPTNGYVPSVQSRTSPLGLAVIVVSPGLLASEARVEVVVSGAEALRSVPAGCPPAPGGGEATPQRRVRGEPQQRPGGGLRIAPGHQQPGVPDQLGAA